MSGSFGAAMADPAAGAAANGEGGVDGVSLPSFASLASFIARAFMALATSCWCTLRL